MTKLNRRFLFYFLCLSICFEIAIGGVMKIPFNRDHFGKKMNGHLVKAIPVLPVNGLTMCVYECLVTPKCFSLNYYPDSALCELNSEDSVTSSGSFVDYEGHVTYTDIAAWPTAIAKTCGGALCSQGQRCVPTPPTYVCLRDECDSPPTVLHATLTPNSTMRGISNNAVYQCENNLILRGTPSIMCRERFIWSDVSFRCAMPGTCKELKHCNSGYTTDGEYWLYPALYNPVDDVNKVKVYCNSMSSAEPTEYITLSGTNDARYNGREAVDYWESTCAIRTYGEVRTTTFQKIRLNPQDMTIINDDFTFSSTTGGDPMKYGTGGDCTFAHGCMPRQGYFHIDTSNTGLIVDKTIEWIGNGWAPKLHDFTRNEDGRLIEIKCGGKCGGCEPERAMNLNINADEGLRNTIRYIQQLQRAAARDHKNGCLVHS